MKRISALLLLLATAVLAFAPPASANLKLVYKEVRWLNQNRYGVRQTTNANAPVDTLYTTVDDSLSMADTTVIVGINDLVMIPSSGSALDSARTILKFTVVCDSTVAPTLAKATIKAQIVGGDAPTGPSAVFPGTTSYSKSCTTVTNGYIVSWAIPLTSVSNSGPVGEASIPSLFMQPNVRFIISGTSGRIGKARAFVSYYADQ